MPTVLGSCLLSVVAALAAEAPRGFSFAMPLKVVLEAEDTKVQAPFRVVASKGASRGKLLSIPVGEEEPPPSEEQKTPARVHYRFSVPKSGRYTAWFRAYHVSNAAPWWWKGRGAPGSLLVSFDGSDAVGKPQVIGRGAATTDRLMWRRLPSPIALKAGVHVMSLEAKKPGISVDQIAIIEHIDGEEDPYVPQGMERSTARKNDGEEVGPY